jgi:hypothetical protein
MTQNTLHEPGWESHHLLATLTVCEVMTRLAVTVAPDRPATEAVCRMGGRRSVPSPSLREGSLLAS